MIRTILSFGLVAAAVLVVGMIGPFVVLPNHEQHASLLVGYLVILVALVAVVLGVKSYRDRALGGVIGFWPALLLGLGITVVASLLYALAWEVYLAFTHYSFMDGYVANMLAAKRAAGVTGAAYAKAVADMEAMKRQYANPVFRLFMTAIEVFPVGVLVALITAAVLRNPRVLPARERAARA